jgi:hypothetical protein
VILLPGPITPTLPAPKGLILIRSCHHDCGFAALISDGAGILGTVFGGCTTGVDVEVDTGVDTAAGCSESSPNTLCHKLFLGCSTGATGATLLATGVYEEVLPLTAGVEVPVILDATGV